MSETPQPAGTRGAVDLTSVSALTAPGAATSGSGMPAGPVPGQRPPAPPRVPEGLVVEVTAATLQRALSRTVQVPGVLVLWSSATLRTFKDYLGMPHEMAAEHVAWAIRRLAGAPPRGGRT